MVFGAQRHREDDGPHAGKVRQPGLTATLLLTLALGTGATTALFSTVDAALLRPLPYPRSDRLMLVRQVDARGGAAPFAPPYLADLRARVSTMDALVGFSPSWSLTLTGTGDPRRVVGAYVSDGLFELLGVRPVAGRAFDGSEHTPDGPAAVAVPKSFWEQHFSGPAAPAGQTITLDGEPYAIVGVLPDFALPVTSSAVSQGEERAELWLPFSANPCSPSSVRRRSCC